MECLERSGVLSAAVHDPATHFSSRHHFTIRNLDMESARHPAMADGTNESLESFFKALYDSPPEAATI